MLRQAQHDVREGFESLPKQLQQVASDIFQATGRNLYDYRTEVYNSAIHHIKKHRGINEYKRGQIPIEASDFLSMEGRILQPVEVKDGGQKPGKLPCVRFTLAIDATKTIVVLSIHEKRKYLAFETMYKRKGQPG